MRLIFEQIRAGGDRNFGYLIADRDAGTGVLVDPSYSPDAFVQRALDQHVTITHIINTHGHADHTNGNARAAELTGAPIAAHADAPSPPEVPLGDGARVTVGAWELHVLHVPGHSADHLAILEPTQGILLTGDLLFVGKVGGTRTEADARVEWDSLERLLRWAPDAATVWPGHDYGARPSSTLALEKQTNPFLLCPDLAAFLQLKAEWPALKAQLGLK